MGFLCRDAGEGGHAVGEVAFAVGDGFLVVGCPAFSGVGYWVF
jgi:hypothetical protein